MFWDKIGPIASAVANSMDKHPERWNIGRYTAYIGNVESEDHPGEKIRIWTSNGVGFVEVYDPWKISFNGRERKMIWMAYKRLKRGIRYEACFIELLRKLEVE